MRYLRDATEVEIRSFEDLVTPLVAYIRDTWNTAGLGPLHHELNKECFEHLPVPGPDDKFKGLCYDNRDQDFPIATCARNVSYADVAQGRSPLDSLISASVAFGMNVESERHRRKLDKATADVERFSKNQSQVEKDAVAVAMAVVRLVLQ